LPSKNLNDTFFTIGEVAQQTGIKPYILRYWEKEFPFLQPIKNKVGHRLYTPKDIYIIKKLKTLIYQKGYSIAGAKKAMWKLLLKNTDDSSQANIRASMLEEIKRDLREVLDIINKSLEKKV